MGWRRRKKPAIGYDHVPYSRRNKFQCFMCGRESEIYKPDAEYQFCIGCWNLCLRAKINQSYVR